MTIKLTFDSSIIAFCVKLGTKWMLQYFILVAKRQSAEWITDDEPNPKRAKTQQLAGNVMTSLFWDVNGIIFIEYLQTGTTTNSKYNIK